MFPNKCSCCPALKEALHGLHERGVLMFVFSQQNCVSKGLIDETGVDVLHAAEMNAGPRAGGESREVLFRTRRLAPATTGASSGPGMLNAVLAEVPGLDASELPCRRRCGAGCGIRRGGRLALSPLSPAIRTAKQRKRGRRACRCFETVRALFVAVEVKATPWVCKAKALGLNVSRDIGVTALSVVTTVTGSSTSRPRSMRLSWLVMLLSALAKSGAPMSAHAEAHHVSSPRQAATAPSG